MYEAYSFRCCSRHAVDSSQPTRLLHVIGDSQSKKSIERRIYELRFSSFRFYSIPSRQGRLCRKIFKKVSVPTKRNVNIQKNHELTNWKYIHEKFVPNRGAVRKVANWQTFWIAPTKQLSFRTFSVPVNASLK